MMVNITGDQGIVQPLQAEAMIAGASGPRVFSSSVLPSDHMDCLVIWAIFQRHFLRFTLDQILGEICRSSFGAGK